MIIYLAHAMSGLEKMEIIDCVNDIVSRFMFDGIKVFVPQYDLCILETNHYKLYGIREREVRDYFLSVDKLMVSKCDALYVPDCGHKLTEGVKKEIEWAIQYCVPIFRDYGHVYRYAKLKPYGGGE